MNDDPKTLDEAISTYIEKGLREAILGGRT